MSQRDMTDTDKARFSQRIIRIDASLMNPKMKCHQLECGHDVYLPRRSRQKFLVCERCARSE